MAKGRGVQYDNKVFGSIYEVARFITLKGMEAKGEISKLECHPKFLLVPPIEGFTISKQIYRRRTSLPELWAEFDFSYIENGKRVIEDVKADGNFYKNNGEWSSSKRGWLLEEAFLIKVKMFLWMKEPSEWDFKIPLVTKEELKIARQNQRMGGTNETARPSIRRAYKRRSKGR